MEATNTTALFPHPFAPIAFIIQYGKQVLGSLHTF